MVCYVATHNDSGKRYVGITKHGLKIRRSQHEKDAMSERNRGPFHCALKKYGKDAFTWKVVAEGEDEAIKLLETALIAEWGTAKSGGFNATGLYAEAPVRDWESERFAEEMGATVTQLYMLNDLDSIVRYCEEHPHMISEHLQYIREMSMRLLKCVDEFNDV